MRTASAFVTVRCRGCDAPRTVSRRQARRAGLCNQCRYPPNETKVEDKHRRFWFDRFTDTELAVLGSEFIERRVIPERLAVQRMALTASARGHGGNGVPSVGEREPSALLSPPPVSRATPSPS